MKACSNRHELMHEKQHKCRSLRTLFSLMRYITNHTRHKKQNFRNIASHFWKSFSCDILGHWEITWENRLQNLCSLIWPREIGAFGKKVLTTEHQHCTPLNSKYFTAKINSHKRQCDSFFGQTNVYSILQHIEEIKVIQSVQRSPYGHNTTPNEGTILSASAPKSPLTWQGNG